MQVGKTQSCKAQVSGPCGVAMVMGVNEMTRKTLHSWLAWYFNESSLLQLQFGIMNDRCLTPLPSLPHDSPLLARK